MQPIHALVVHCAATPAGKPFRAADIDKWHRAKGWNGIGYHYVVCLDGSVEPGRDVDTVGSHVRGHNVGTLAICLIGGVGSDGQPKDTFNAAQFDALELLLLGLRAKHPRARIMGHRDFPDVAKACPSFDVSVWLTRRGIVPNPTGWSP